MTCCKHSIVTCGSYNLQLTEMQCDVSAASDDRHVATSVRRVVTRYLRNRACCWQTAAVAMTQRERGVETSDVRRRVLSHQYVKVCERCFQDNQQSTITTCAITYTANPPIVQTTSVVSGTTITITIIIDCVLLCFYVYGSDLNKGRRVAV